MTNYEYSMSRHALTQSIALSNMARQMLNVSVAISDGTTKIANSNLQSAEKIAESNAIIATGIFQSAFFMRNALTTISAEMKKKRELDEYYLLTERIDSLHKKIIQEGGNLLEVYQKMTSSVREQMSITDADIKFICELFQKESDLDCLIKQSEFYEETPIETVKKIFGEAKYAIVNDNKDNTCLYLKALDYTVELEKYEINFGKIVDGNCNYKGMLIPAKKEWDGKLYWVFKIFLDKESGLELFEDVRKHFLTQSHFELATLQQIEKIEKIKNFVEEMNWQIVLNNLRTLYSELREAHTKLLFNKSKRK